MKKNLLLGILLISTLGLAQWTTDYEINTLVADATTGDIQSIGTHDGKTYVVFWDESAGYKLRAQLLDADGVQQWGSNGILVNAIADNSTWTATRSLTVDEEGNLIVGFTATGDGNGYVNKISPTGEQLFGENGIALPDAWDLKVSANFIGGAIVGWTENGVGKLTVFDSDGSSAFPEPITLNSPNSSRPFTGIGEIANLSDGNFVVVFHTKPTGWSIESIPYAQKYSMDGVAMWEEPIQVSTQTLASNRSYPIHAENDITYFGYYGSTGWRFDSFIQRINADGTLPWGEDGADFSTNEAFLEMETSFVMNENADEIWVASNLCNSNQSQYGIYVQKIKKDTGERLLGDEALEIFPVDPENSVHVGSIQLAEDKPIFLFSNDISNGINPIQLGVVTLNNDGTPANDDLFQMIATSEGNKGRFDFTTNVEGQSVAIWTEIRNGTSKAYAQNIEIEIDIVGTEDLQTTKMRIYPNPVQDVLTIDSKATIQKIEVYDVSGRLVSTKTNSKFIQLNHLPKGNYIVKTTTNKGEAQAQKFIKN